MGLDNTLMCALYLNSALIFCVCDEKFTKTFLTCEIYSTIISLLVKVHNYKHQCII
jgi:hypothetical protein